MQDKSCLSRAACGFGGMQTHSVATAADCRPGVAPFHFLQSCRACCLAKRCRLIRQPLKKYFHTYFYNGFVGKLAAWCKIAGPASIQKVGRRHTQQAISSSGRQCYNFVNFDEFVTLFSTGADQYQLKSSGMFRQSLKQQVAHCMHLDLQAYLSIARPKLQSSKCIGHF